jgi:hypothetical protein
VEKNSLPEIASQAIWKTEHARKILLHEATKSGMVS